jgi:WD40 repeat protein
MSDLFISYSRGDSAFVQKLYQTLGEHSARELDMWVDFEDIPYSVDWWGRICKGIEAANNVLIVISESWLTSEVCNEEIEYALKHNKRLIPVLFAPVEEELRVQMLSERPWSRREKQLADDQWQIVKTLNWIDCSKLPFEGVVTALASTIDEDVDYKDRHTELLTGALQWEGRGRDNSFRLTGKKIAEAESWLVGGVGKTPQPTPLQVEYIASSRRAEIQRQRTLLVGVSTAAIVTLILAVISLLLFQQSQERRVLADANAATAERRADESQSLALAANAQLAQSNDALLGLSLAVEANMIDRPPPLAQQVLSEIAYAPTTLIQRFTGVHQNRVETVAFHSGGSMVATGAVDGSLALWNVITGQVIHLLVGHLYPINDLAFSPDGRWLLSAAGDVDLGGELFLWDVESGELLRRFEGHTESVNHALFSPDGQTALSTGNDDLIIRWDVNTGEELRRYDAFVAGVGGITYSPDGQTFFTGSSFTAPSQLIQWDVNTGRRLKRYDLPYAVSDLAISSDGQFIAYTALFDEPVVALLDANTGNELRRFEGHRQAVRAVAFSPDDQWIVTGSSDNTARLWNAATGELLYTFSVLEQIVFDVAFSADGSAILFSKSDGSAELWNADQNRPGAVERRFLFPELPVFDVDLSPDGKRILAAVGFDLVLLDANTGEELRRFLGHLTRDVVYHAVFLPDGQRALSASADNTLILWDVATGEAIRQFEGHEDEVRALAVSADGNTAVSGGLDGKVIWWDLNTGNVLKQFESPGGSISSLAFSPDESRIAGGTCPQFTDLGVCLVGEVMMWDVETGGIQRRQPGHDGQVDSVNFSLDGRLLLSGAADNSIMLWDAETLESVKRLSGHESGVTSAIFSADSSAILSASLDRSLILWDVASGQAIRRLQGLDIRNNALAWSADGRMAVAGGGSSTFSGQIAVWRLDVELETLVGWTYQNRFVRELTCQEREQYQVVPPCDAAGVYPTRTPYPIDNQE